MGQVMLAQSMWGMNFLDIYTWNKAAIGKMLWNLCQKKDKLWVVWIHTYYGKNGIWNVQDGQASLVIQKILKVAKHLQKAGFSEADMESIEKYNMSRVYMQMRG